MLKVFKTKLLPSGAHSLALLQRSEKQESSYEARSIDLRRAQEFYGEEDSTF